MVPWLVGFAVLFTVLCYTTEQDQPFVGTLALLLVLGFCQVATPFQPLTLATENVGTALFCALAYLIIGPIVGTLKWASFAYNMAERWAEAREKSLSALSVEFKRKNPDFDPGNLTKDEKDSLVRRTQIEFGYGVEMPLQVRKHKSRVITWMVYWPVTLFWLVLHDPIRRFCNFAFRSISDLLTRISNRAMASVNADFQ